MTHLANLTVPAASVSENHTDFIVDVDLSDLDAVGDFWNTVLSGGGDIRVYLSDGTTQVPRHVLSCVPATATTGTGRLKFKASLSSTVDNVFQIHGDGVSAEPGAGTTYGKNAVYSNDGCRLHFLTDLVDDAGNNTFTAVDTGRDPTLGSAPPALFNVDGVGDAACAGFSPGSGYTITMDANFLNLQNWDAVTGGWSGLEASPKSYPSLWQESTGSIMRVYHQTATTSGDWSLATGWSGIEGAGRGLVQIVWDGANTISVYRNGVLLTSNSSPTGNTALDSPNGNLFTIGCGVTNAGAYQYTNDLDLWEYGFTNVARSANWIADEYANRNSPGTFYSVAVPPAGPTLTNPTESSIGRAQATIECDTDTALGELWVVVTTSATPPSAAQIKLGQDHLGAAAAYAASDVTPTATTTFSATGLSPATTYYSYFYQENGGDTSNILESGSWATLAHPVLSNPVESSITTTTATVSCDTDTLSGTVYAYISTSATPPSTTDLKNGTGAVWSGSDATPTATTSFAATGLTQNTTYYTYFYQEDGADGVSNVLQSGSWVTLVAGAPGAIASVAIAADGWSADVTITDWATEVGDVVYNFGDPAGGAGNVTFTVTSEGYNASGVLGTIQRTVYGTAVVRQADPNDASLDESASGSDLVIRIALSECVYNDDKNGGAGTSGVDPTVTIAAGWARHSGTTDNSAATGLAVTNNSTLDYPKVIGQWAWNRTPAEKRVEGAFDVAFRARHGFGISAVALSATGAVSANVDSSIQVNNATQIQQNGLYTEAYVHNVASLASFTQGENIVLRAIAYPVVGDADSILDTADTTTDADDIRGLTEITVTCDKTGALKSYGVVTTTGNDGTGVVSTTLATAEASPYATVGAALEDGATVVYVRTGNHDILGSSPVTVTALDYYREVRPHPSDLASGIALQRGGTHTQYKASKLAYIGFSGGIETDVSNQGGLDGEGTGKLRFEGCVFSTVSIPTDGLGRNSLGCWFVECDGLGGDDYLEDGANPVAYTFTGCTFADVFSTSCGYTLVGCDCADADGSVRFRESTTFNAAPDQNNVMIEHNSLKDLNPSGDLVHLGELIALSGLSVVGNVIERTTADMATAQALWIGGQGSAVAVDNVVVAHNTIVGVPVQMFWNESGASALARDNVFLVGNALRGYTIGTDTTTPANGNRTGNWAQLYGVNYKDNRWDGAADATLVNEYQGINGSFVTAANQIYTDITYTNDASLDGTGLGNGNYLPADAELIGQNIHLTLIDYDLLSNAANDDIGAVQTAGGPGPGITLSAPTEADITDTTATVGCNTDTLTGTLYVYVGTNPTPPNATDLKAGTGAVFSGSQLTPTATETFAVTGLNDNTTYYTYFYQEDGGSVSNILESGAWSTIPSAITLSNAVESGIGETTATVSVDTDTLTGVVYAYVSESATPPSIGIIKSGTGAAWHGNDATPTATTSFAVTGLTPLTDYYTHFYQEDGASQSNIITSAQWSTPLLSGIYPDNVLGVTFSEVRFRTAGDSNVRFTGDVQIANKSTITVKVNAIEATLEWDGTQYAGPATEIATYLSGQVGNGIPIIVEY